MGKPCKAAGVTLVLGVVLCTFACDLWGPQDNPVDPGAGNYQGYPTVSSSNLIRAILPADGEGSYDRYLTVTAVDGADGYQLRISDSIEGLDESSPLFEKSDYSSNVFDIGDAPLSGDRTYFWKARAFRSGTWDAEWSPVGSFYAVKNEWTLQAGAGSKNWESIGMSGNGIGIVANGSSNVVGDTQISKNGGVDWEPEYADCIAVSTSSKFIYTRAYSHTLRIYKDGEDTFWYSYFPLWGLSSLAMSATGSRFIGCDGNFLVIWFLNDTSYDYRIVDIPAKYVASSGTGSTLYAADNSVIMVSRDYGKTWGQLSIFSAPGSISSIVCDPQGSYIAYTELNGSIWTSSNYGETWVNRTTAGNRAWRSIAINSDGSKLAAVEFNGYIWTSSDYGLTWKVQTGAGSRAWTSVACSSDGTRIAACENGGESWTVGWIWTGVLSYWE